MIQGLTQKGIEKRIEKQSKKQKAHRQRRPRAFNLRVIELMNERDADRLYKSFINQMNILTRRTVMTRPMNNSAI
jgi:hypothetical protein